MDITTSHYIRGVTMHAIRRDLSYQQYLTNLAELYVGLAISEEDFKELKLKQLLGVKS